MLILRRRKFMVITKSVVSLLVVAVSLFSSPSFSFAADPEDTNSNSKKEVKLEIEPSLTSPIIPMPLPESLGSAMGNFDSLSDQLTPEEEQAIGQNAVDPNLPFLSCGGGEICNVINANGICQTNFTECQPGFHYESGQGVCGNTSCPGACGKCVKDAGCASANDCPAPAGTCTSCQLTASGCQQTCPVATCSGGQCGTGSVVQACNASACAGQCLNDSQCGDGVACTTDKCVSGRCEFTPNNSACPSSNPCLTGTCNAQQGCIFSNNANNCNDNNQCTTNDICSNGSCSGVQKNCNDNVACTVDSCNTTIGCQNIPNNSLCNDGNPCTTDTCSAQGCVSVPTPGHEEMCGGTCVPQGTCPGECPANQVLCGGICVPNGQCPNCPATQQLCGGICVPIGQCQACPAGQQLCYGQCVAMGSCPACPSDKEFCASNNQCVTRGQCQCDSNNDCNDVNDCTTDSCTNGLCLYSNNSNPCNDGTSCTVGDVCRNGVCGGNPLTCPAGQSCRPDDGQCYCPNGEYCVATGSCVELGSCTCTNNTDCRDGNVCTDDACVEGVCVRTNNSTSCGDGNNCTANDICVNGVCSGNVVMCQQGQNCRASDGQCVCPSGMLYCERTGGCVPQGQCECSSDTECWDGNVCTNDACVNGLCQNDFNTNSCSDGNSCTSADICVQGVCRGNAVTCPGDGTCRQTDGQCICPPGKAFCPATNRCETSCACNTALDCNDGSVCTTDQCVNGQCTRTNNTGQSCNDGNACTKNDQCDVAGICKGTISTCSGGQGCQADDGQCACPVGQEYCATLGKCVSSMENCRCAADFECDDGNICTSDSCEAGKCVRTFNGVSCDDGNACTQLDRCSNGSCTGTGTVCIATMTCRPEDGQCACPPGQGFCPDTQTCQPFGQCICERNEDCQDGNICTYDYCQDGRCTYPSAQGTYCDDGNNCTTNDTCQNDATCIGSPVGCGPMVCNPNNPYYSLCECPVGTVWCISVNECRTPDNCQCNYDNDCPSNECLRGFCSNTRCEYTPTGAGPCNDGNACTSGDACDNGVCKGAPTVQCPAGQACDINSGSCECPPGYNFCAATQTCLSSTQKCSCDTDEDCALGDNNPCTNNVCYNGACIYEDNPGGTCSDDNACTTGDTCGPNGSCQPGAEKSCSGGRTCNPGNGECVCPYSVPYFCAALGQCVPSSESCAACYSNEQCNDQNVCTTDQCVNGSCQHTNYEGACDDGNNCTFNDTCSQGSCSGTIKYCPDGQSCQGGNCICPAGTPYFCTKLNRCVLDQATCETTPNCQADTDCDDQKVCTDDQCISGQCMNSFNSAACNDNNLCTTGDQCSNGICEGTVKYCPDGQRCNVSTGGCGCPSENPFWCPKWNQCMTDAAACNSKPVCTEDSQCDDSKVCTTDRCINGSCMNVFNTESCNDHDSCTTADSCFNGVCQGNAINCPDVQQCNPSNGQCACPPEMPFYCVKLDRCVVSQNNCPADGCAGDPSLCDDRNPCTDDICGSNGSCTRVNNTNACNDNNACTESDQCNGGSCGGIQKYCPDIQVCGPTGECSCPPGNPYFCATLSKCIASEANCRNCTGALDCNDSNPCTDDVCNSNGFCSHPYNNASCSDNNACTTGDACSAGVCAGNATQCPDSQICNVANGQCICPVNLPYWCAQLNRCVSNAISCASCQSDADCDDSKVFTDDRCNNGTCENPFNNAPCDDRNMCTDGDHYVDGLCRGGTARFCPGSEQSCNPWTGECVCAAHVPYFCTKLNRCVTSEEVCNSGRCASAADCNDGKVCTDNVCMPDGSCSNPFNQAPCNDSFICTTGDICNAGTCSGTEVYCEGGKVCDEAGGGSCVCPSNSPYWCAQLNDCVRDAAACGNCVSNDSCDDNNACTTDSCTNGRCSNVLNTNACDDADPCTLGDACSSGVCHGEPKVCPDSQMCVNGNCQCPSHLPVWCSKLNRCVASAGECEGKSCTVNNDCRDGNSCTDDICRPDGSCSNPYNTSSCDDGDFCSVSDVCSDGLCRGVPKYCDGGRTCNPSSGSCQCPSSAPYWCAVLLQCVASESQCATGCANDSDCVGIMNPCVDLKCIEQRCQGIPNQNPCNDGNNCTLGDRCEGGTCEGESKFCPDTRGCNLNTGQCECPAHLPFFCVKLNACVASETNCPADGCASDAECNDGKICTEDRCIGGICSNNFGTGACDDGNKCTLGDTCSASNGQCQAGTQKYCAGNQVCDPASGSCICPEGLIFCESRQTCVASPDDCTACQANGDCADNNACTDDSCQNGQCYFYTNTRQCNDGNANTLCDTCVNGVCAAGTPSPQCCPANQPYCALTGQCQTTCSGGGGGAQCQTNMDCSNFNTPGSCQLWQCVSGQCTSTPLNGTSCGTDACWPGVCSNGICESSNYLASPECCSRYSGYTYCGTTNQCVPPNGNCPACTTAADCQPPTGQCAGSVQCESGQCVYGSMNGLPCDDGNGCTIGDSCQGTQCSGTTMPSPGQGCCPNGYCGTTGACLGLNETCPACAADADCQSVQTGDECLNTEGRCSAGVCQYTYKYGTPCDDNNSCTTGDYCYSGRCNHTGVAPGPQCCPNDQPYCYQTGQCQSADSCRCQTNSDCNDQNNCTNDSCNTGTGECEFTASSGESCDDGRACTGSDTCSNGVCTGSPIASAQCCPSTAPYCPATNSCSANCTTSCTTTSDCPSTGNPCKRNICYSGVCTLMNVSGSCNDGNACTSPDICRDGGVCSGNFHSTPQCCPASTPYCPTTARCQTEASCPPCNIDRPCVASGNPCAGYTCNEQTGICNLQNTAGACDDGNACTVTDSCSNGVCQGIENCPNGTICTNRQCVGPASCTTNTECLAGQSCVNGLCQNNLQCNVTADCALGRKCENGQCVISSVCTTNSDCPLNQLCTNSQCLGGNPCNSVSQCINGQSCIMGVCQTPSGGGQCTDNTNCSGGQSCINGSCAYGNLCTIDSQCAAGQICASQTICNAQGKCTIEKRCAGGGACNYTSQCPFGQSCINGTCQISNSCTSNADCTGNQVCWPTTQMCVGGGTCSTNSQCSYGQKCYGGLCLEGPGNCDSDADCPPGSVCGNSMNTRMCQSGGACSTNGDCGGQISWNNGSGMTGYYGQICIEGQCSGGNSCTTSAQCSYGQNCIRGACYGGGTCNTNIECGWGNGYSCINGVCQIPKSCTANSDCPSNQTCVNGLCEGGSGCVSDAQCPSGQHCNAQGICLANGACLTEADCGGVPGQTCINRICQSANCPGGSCPNGKICVDGVCKGKPCSTNLQCTPLFQNGAICVDGECTGGNGCTTDAQCTNGQTCINGRCSGGGACWTTMQCSRNSVLVQVCYNGTCQGGNSCTTASDCTAGQKCLTNTSNGGMCIGGGSCTSNGNCAAGESCINEVCTGGCGSTCNSDADCSNGQSCVMRNCGPGPAKMCTGGGSCTADFHCKGNSGLDEICVAGQCVKKPTCTVDADCTNGVCVGGTCSGGGMCSTNAHCSGSKICLNGTCSGGDACTTNENCTVPGQTCMEGVCKGGGTCSGHVECANGGQVCVNGTCQARPSCTDNSSCPSGMFCNSSKLCQINICNLNSDCNDGKPCNGVEQCQSGQCVAGTPISCTGGQICNDATGTCACPAGQFYCAQIGLCVATPALCQTCANDSGCNDNNLCTDDRCYGGVCQYSNNSAPCEDGNKCTTNVCSGGQCVGTAKSCPSGKACRPADGYCVGGGNGGCSSAAQCDDGDPCTHDYCSFQQVCQWVDTGCGGWQQVCQTVGSCAHSVGNFPCSDNVNCTSPDTCMGGVCVSGPAVSCPAGQHCSETQGGACVCDMAGQTYCSILGRCVPTGTCPQCLTAGDCNDNNPCTNESCNAQQKCAYVNNTDNCDDYNLCTVNDKCNSGYCFGTAKTCPINETCNTTDGNCYRCPIGQAWCSITQTCLDPAQCVIRCDMTVGSGGTAKKGQDIEISVSSSCA